MITFGISVVMDKVKPCVTSLLRAIFILLNLSFMLILFVPMILTIMFLLNGLEDFHVLISFVSFNWLCNYALFIIIYAGIKSERLLKPHILQQGALS